jgi:hypothetical protein
MGNPRLAFPIAQPPERAAFFAAYKLRPFEEVRKTFFRMPSVPVRMASKMLSPEMKEKIKKIIR